jgi:hypothetical protein
LRADVVGSPDEADLMIILDHTSNVHSWLQRFRIDTWVGFWGS